MRLSEIHEEGGWKAVSLSIAGAILRWLLTVLAIAIGIGVWYGLVFIALNKQFGVEMADPLAFGITTMAVIALAGWEKLTSFDFIATTVSAVIFVGLYWATKGI